MPCRFECGHGSVNVCHAQSSVCSARDTVTDDNDVVRPFAAEGQVFGFQIAGLQENTFTSI